MSKPDNLNRVQSIKQKFESHILNNSPNNLVIDKNKIIKRALTTSSIILPQKSVERKNSAPITIDEENKKNCNNVDDSSNQPTLRLQRQLSDPSRKSLIKRSPAFRCDKIKHLRPLSEDDNRNLANEADSDLADERELNFLSHKYKDVSCSGSSMQLSNTLINALKQPLPAGPPPQKPPRTFAHDSPLTRSPVSESPDKNVEQEVQTEFDNKQLSDAKNTDVGKREPDVNYMLKKLEQALLDQEIQKNNLPDLIKNDSFKISKEIISDCLQKQQKLNRENKLDNNTKPKNPNENHYMVTNILDDNSSNCGPFFNGLLHSLNCASGSTSYTTLSNGESNNTCKSCEFNEHNIKIKSCEVCFKAGNEHIYSEPFHHLQENKVLPIVNTETAICAKVCEQAELTNVQKMIGNFQQESNTFKKKSGSFNSTTNNVIGKSFNSYGKISSVNEHSTIQNSVEVRNSTYMNHNAQDKPALHYLCTPIYDIPSDNLIPEAINFNIIKQECRLICTNNEFDNASLQRRPNFLHINNNTVNNYFDKNKIQAARNDQIMVDDIKTADSGLSSMETTPDNDEENDLRIIALSPSVAERRKIYVTRMSSLVEYESATKKLTDKTNLNSCYSTIKKSESKVSSTSDDDEKLFEICMLVGYNVLTSEGYVKNVYPAGKSAPEHIENFIFPELKLNPAVKPKKSKNSNNMLKPNENVKLANNEISSSKISSSKNHKKYKVHQIHDEQNYSIVLTDEYGIRRFGYCRKILPEDSDIYLPLVYCIITRHRAPGFYFKVLKELESRHGVTEYQQKNIINQLHNSKLPQPGKNIHIKLPNSPRPKSEIPTYYLDVPDVATRTALNFSGRLPTSRSHSDLKSELEVKFEKITGNGTVSKENDNAIKESATPKEVEDRFGVINRRLLNPNYNKNFTEIVIKRPYDFRLENNELSILFECLNVETLINVFGSLLIERKVILVGESMSKICACIEGIQSIMYPFVWQHPLVSILPQNLIEIISAPIPIIAGILERAEDTPVEEGILVNIDTSTILECVGDEATLIPTHLNRALKLSLSLVKNTTQRTDPTRNVLVSEAFIKFFVASAGNYMNGFIHNKFQKHTFINSYSCKATRLFLEWFVETTMFNHFILNKTNILQNQSDFEGKNNIQENNFNRVVKTTNNIIEQLIIETIKDDLVFIDKADKCDNSIKNSNESPVFNKKINKSNNIDNSPTTSSESNSSSPIKIPEKSKNFNEYYEIFDARVLENKSAGNSGKNTELFIKNHKLLNRKGFVDKFKDFMSS